MTQVDFETAVARARSKSQYFPTSSAILKAYEEIKAERRKQEADEPLHQASNYSPEDLEVSAQRAKDVWQALKTGRRPEWMN